FTRSGVDAVWTPEAGSLLDLAEAAGLALKSHCRSGTCGSCRQAITAGTIKQMQAPALPVPTGTALLCSTVPVSDLVVAA
ncbi:MAG: 2Fe-2S iron-sulfur cluster-binding protein, partial [Ferrovibrionaceae bacterium]